LHVFVRDWLSGNQVILRSPGGHVVVDTGYAKHVPLTLALVASRAGLDGDLLAKVVNTHCPSDHLGGNAALRRAYGCTIAVPEHEAVHVEAWDTRALLLDYAGQEAERFGVDERLRAGDTHVWGDLQWQMLAAPGHDMGALVFYNAEHGILISGDALWEDGFGFVLPREMDPDALPATRATLDLLAGLDVAVVIPGHGEPFTDHRGALARAYARLDALEADSMRSARHAVKVVLTFNLLDRERFVLQELPAYLDRVPLFREFNDRFLHRTPDDLAAWLTAELCRAGVAAIDGDSLVPATRTRASPSRTVAAEPPPNPATEATRRR
jgi:glyoxylase-like metal-dependent hydrolase (beta-lactamase superfamily II)